MGLPDPNMIVHELLERAQLAKHPARAMKMAVLVQDIADRSVEEIAANWDKLAEVVDLFDEVEGLRNQYGRGGITYPADFLCGISRKEAQAFVDNSVKLNKLIFSAVKLAAEVPVQFYVDVVGEEFPARVVDADKRVNSVKLAAALKELPQGKKSALEERLVATYR